MTSKLTKPKVLTEKDIAEGRKLMDAFSDLSDIGKSMVISYLSALRDKELADQKAG